MRCKFKKLMLIALIVSCVGVTALTACDNKETTETNSDNSTVETNSSVNSNSSANKDTNSNNYTPTASIDKSLMDKDSQILITFSDNGVTCQNNNNCSIENNTVKISKSGTYVFSGKCNDGNIIVKDGVENVFIILNNLDLTSQTTAPIECKKSTSVAIIANDNTINTLSDTAKANTENSVIKIKTNSNLTITGNGTININANYKNAIKGAESSSVTIDTLNLSIKSVNNGISDDNCIIINSGNINIESGNDCIKSEPNEEDNNSIGDIIINNGNITLTSTGDGISANNNLSINGGIINIITNGAVSPNNNDSFGGNMGGYSNKNFKFDFNESNYDNSTDDSSSKGIKAANNLYIKDGNITINSTDHCIHSTGETSITGGIITISSSVKKGISAHGNLTIDGETTDITVKKATEGIESKQVITINNGSIIIQNASDDGLNSGGNALSNHNVVINNGYLFVNANGDALDSNGNIIFNGGTTIMVGPNNGGNSCIDSEGGSSFNGGIVLGVASSNSMWTMDVIGHINGDYVYNTSIGNVSKDDTIAVLDKDGNVLTAINSILSGNIGIVYMNSNISDISSCTFNIGGTYSEDIPEYSYKYGGTINGGISASQGSNFGNNFDGNFGGGGFGGEGFGGNRPHW